MGIFDFFKAKKEEPKLETVRMEEIDKWLAKAKENNKTKEARVLDQIQKLITNFIVQIETKNKVLDKVDLSKRKEDEKLKAVVLENVELYSNHVLRLIESLENMDKNTLENLIISIDNSLFEFKKRSNMSYERATYLVGKEIAEIKDAIAEFVKNLKEIVEKDKEIVNSARIFDFAGNKLMAIIKEEELIEELRKEIEEINKELKKLSSEIKNANKKLEDSKKSKDYLALGEEKNKAIIKKEEIKKEILQLRQLIDFKSLIKNYHSVQKKMDVIHHYEQYFEDILNPNANSDFLDMIDNKKNILDLINKINKENEEIKNSLNKKDILIDIYSDITKIDEEIRSSSSQKGRAEDNIEKIKENILKIKKEIAKEFLTINIRVESE